MRVAITCAVILCAAVFHARADEAPVFSQLTFDDTITRTTVSADGHAVTAWVSSTVNGSPAAAPAAGELSADLMARIRAEVARVRTRLRAIAAAERDPEGLPLPLSPKGPRIEFTADWSPRRLHTDDHRLAIVDGEEFTVSDADFAALRALLERARAELLNGTCPERRGGAIEREVAGISSRIPALDR